MSDMTIQWIVVGAVIALCIWRVIGSVRRNRRRKRNGGASAGSCCSGCAGCPIADNCKKPRK